MAELSSSVSVAGFRHFCEFYGSWSYQLTLAGLDSHLPLLSHSTNQLFLPFCMSLQSACLLYHTKKCLGMVVPTCNLSLGR